MKYNREQDTEINEKKRGYKSLLISPLMVFKSSIELSFFKKTLSDSLYTVDSQIPRTPNRIEDTTREISNNLLINTREIDISKYINVLEIIKEKNKGVNNCFIIFQFIDLL
ncbi:hypothetical protein [uncultured Algoriphagus sp.]|uniref:hypothetical protein n=1 Tax=uncultured Algoriphagus sp. TaxID=417365 RepID=UPI0030ECAA88